MVIYRNEADVVKDILFNLVELNRIHPKHKGKIYVWRNNTGADKQEDKSRRRGYRFIQYGKVGSSDILGSFHGFFLAIECKYGKNTPTRAQYEFLEQIRATGGFGVLAYSWQDVAKALPIL